MKLVIATPLYPPEIGGPATYAEILMRELPKSGIEVELVKFSDVRHLPNAIRHIAYARNIFHAARHADAILALDVLSVGWPAFFANIFLGKKFIVKIVGDHIWEQGKQRFWIKGSLDEFPRFSFSWHPYLWFLRTLQFVVARSADCVIVPSEYLKKVIVRWGIAPEKIAVIYNGITLPDDLVVPPKNENEFLIVSSGRRVHWKGFEAIERVASREANWRVFVASELPREEALGWVKAADVFVLNSRYEGLSHALIEALMLGTPVIATDAGGNGELITNGQTGLLVPPGDEEALFIALKNVAHDPHAASARAQAARTQTERFSVEAMLSATSKLMLDVVRPTHQEEV